MMLSQKHDLFLLLASLVVKFFLCISQRGERKAEHMGGTLNLENLDKMNQLMYSSKLSLSTKTQKNNMLTGV